MVVEVYWIRPAPFSSAKKANFKVTGKKEQNEEEKKKRKKILNFFF